MTAPDDLWRHQSERPAVDLDALPESARTIALRVRAALADSPIPDPAVDHDVRCLVSEVLAPSDGRNR